MFEPIFTKEFLDKELNREVVSFKVGPGSKPGDNFSGAIYAFDVKLKLQSEDGRIRNISTSPGEETETVHLVGKFYPNNADHWWLNHSSIFHKELNIYNTLIRAFEEFVEDYFPVDNNQNETEEMLSLPFAQIFGGKAIDFSKIKGTPTPVLPNLILSENSLLDNFEYGPLDNYILLEDIRKTSDHKMTSVRIGLDLDHASVVIKNLAKLHAVSWACQQKLGISRLIDKFPFLMQSPLPPMSLREPHHHSCFDSATKILEGYLGSESPVVSGTKKIKIHACEILGWFHTDDLIVGGLMESDLEIFMRTPHASFKDEKMDDNDYKPWRVFVHGDCWTHNILFQYCKKTNRPVDAVFVDFQASKEACPTLDLAYFLCICTDKAFRQSHTESLLQQYHDAFVYYCSLFSCSLLPDFSMTSLKERFRRAKLYTYSISVIVFPLILKPTAEELQNIADTQHKLLSDGNGIPELSKGRYSSLLHKKLVELASEIYDDGII